MRKFFVFIVLYCCSTIVFGALDLELTQGVDGAIPMAVVHFSGESQLSSGLTSVIEKDLKNSGHFNVLSQKRFREHPHDQAQVNYKYWRSLDLDDLVVGSVKKIKQDSYQVTFVLLNLYGNKTTAPLLNKTYTMKAKSVRGLAHHISDQIFQKLLGKKGVFSTHIAYVLVKGRHQKKRAYYLMVSEVDGHNQQALVKSDEPIMSPTWSPDGRRIAYVSFEGHKAAVFVQTVLTGRRRKIADFEGINGAPAWSPDGNKLAVVLSKTGYPKIYILDVHTKKLTQLTDGWAIDTEPSFAPDGQSLIFTSNRGGGPQIYQVQLNGGRPERITFDGRYNATASFTSDGNAIILLHKENHTYHIALMELSTGMMEVLTQSGFDQSPSLAPNDEMVVFATRHGKKQVLGMVSRDAKIRIRLPAQEGDVREPAWSPA